jgi:talin
MKAKRFKSVSDYFLFLWPKLMVKIPVVNVALTIYSVHNKVQILYFLLQTYVSTDHVEKEVSAEELIRCTKPITVATAKAVAAGNSGLQDDVIVAANMGRKAVADLLKACKGASLLADSEDGRRRVLGVGQQCSESYRELLESVHMVSV